MSASLHAGEGQLTVNGVRLDTHMPLDDCVYVDGLASPAWPAITYLTVAQRPGTNLFDIRYKVEDADSATVEVVGMVMDDVAAPAGGGKRFVNKFIAPLTTLVEGSEANLGANVPTGSDVKHIVWDAGADLGGSVRGIYIHLMASDGRPPLSLHFVTVPAKGPDPAFHISKYAGFGNLGMLDNLWLWLLAKGFVRRDEQNPENLVGVEDPHAGQTLATGYGDPNETGKAFLCDVIGAVRLATTAEVQRAQEATTAGTVTAWPPFRQRHGRPVKINEYGIETDGPDDYYLVRE